MASPIDLTQLPEKNIFRKGDVFVLFGELFGRGYANGLVDEARKAGMEIIGMTVGRRDESGGLRALTPDELSEAEARLGGRIINVPLMAGFDQDAPPLGPTPTSMLDALTLKTWSEGKLDWDQLHVCRELGRKRFQDGVAQAMAQLDGMIPDASNVFFAHTMAGGILKAKVFLVIANRIYKGRGDRFMSSDLLLGSDLGKLMLQNFEEVTANTFQYLIEGSAAIRARVESSGGQVRYTAYGYHGTKILIDDVYQWQTYTNYTQGYAKMRLEEVARAAWAQGIKATVFNCREIRTNSSDIFVGVELPLLSLLLALKKEGQGVCAAQALQECQSLLKEGESLDILFQKIEDFTSSDIAKRFRNFDAWPMPNDPALADLMIGTSEFVDQMHTDRKQLITDYLSTLVLKATGPLIFSEASDPAGPVLWLNHDIIARQLNRMQASLAVSGPN